MRWFWAFARQALLSTSTLLRQWGSGGITSLKYLGVHISNTLTWRHNTLTICKKSQQCLYFLRKLKNVGLDINILITFYRCVVESTLSSSVCYGSCTEAEKVMPHKVVRSAQRIIWCILPVLSDIYASRCRSRATFIMRDSTHPAHGLFSHLPSGKRLCGIWARTTRLMNSF